MVSVKMTSFWGARRIIITYGLEMDFKSSVLTYSCYILLLFTYLCTSSLVILVHGIWPNKFKFVQPIIFHRSELLHIYAKRQLHELVCARPWRLKLLKNIEIYTCTMIFLLALFDTTVKIFVPEYLDVLK